MRKICAMCGFVFGKSLLAWAANVPAVSDAGTNFLNVPMPPGEKSYLVSPDYPASRIWRFQNTNDVEIHTTCRGVGPDSALVIRTISGRGQRGR